VVSVTDPYGRILGFIEIQGVEILALTVGLCCVGWCPETRDYNVTVKTQKVLSNGNLLTLPTCVNSGTRSKSKG
jgi:hypothetical protein